MGPRQARGGFTFVELGISLSVVSILLAILLPALSSARMSSWRALCAGNQRVLSQAWSNYLDSNQGRFPVLYDQAAWMYGGVRFSRVDGSPFLDHGRPLNRYLPGQHPGVQDEELFRCPADQGIRGEHSEVGTGRRTAFEAFGTSYRANTRLIGPRTEEAWADQGLPRAAITTAASRLVVMGDAVWYEVREGTGRLATWHGVPDAGNMLFLDGSVRFLTIEPKTEVGAAVFDPLAPEFLFPGGRSKGSD